MHADPSLPFRPTLLHPPPPFPLPTSVSNDLLRSYLESSASTPWEALRYLIAEATYGGRVTDEADRRVLACYMSRRASGGHMKRPCLQRRCWRALSLPASSPSPRRTSPSRPPSFPTLPPTPAPTAPQVLLPGGAGHPQLPPLPPAGLLHPRAPPAGRLPRLHRCPARGRQARAAGPPGGRGGGGGGGGAGTGKKGRAEAGGRRPRRAARVACRAAPLGPAVPPPAGCCPPTLTPCPCPCPPPHPRRPPRDPCPTPIPTPTPRPEAFGQHPNAEISYLVEDARSLLDGLAAITPRSGGTGSSGSGASSSGSGSGSGSGGPSSGGGGGAAGRRDEAVAAIAADLLDQVGVGVSVGALKRGKPCVVSLGRCGVAGGCAVCLALVTPTAPRCIPSPPRRRRQIPTPFNLEAVMRAKADDPSALHVVLFQEVRRGPGASVMGAVPPVLLCPAAQHTHTCHPPPHTHTLGLPSLFSHALPPRPAHPPPAD
jgi:hypothetical protein